MYKLDRKVSPSSYPQVVYQPDKRLIFRLFKGCVLKQRGNPTEDGAVDGDLFLEGKSLILSVE